MLELKFLCSNFLRKKFELVRTPVLLTILAELSRAPPSMLARSGSLGFALLAPQLLLNCSSIEELYARYARYAREQSEQKPYCSSYSPNVRRTFGEYLASMGEQEEQSSSMLANCSSTNFCARTHARRACSASMLGEYSAFLRSNSCSFPTLG